MAVDLCRDSGVGVAKNALNGGLPFKIQGHAHGLGLRPRLRGPRFRMLSIADYRTTTVRLGSVVARNARQLCTNDGYRVVSSASDGRRDGGVYWQSGAKSTPVVYVSNVNIGERSARRSGGRVTMTRASDGGVRLRHDLLRHQPRGGWVLAPESLLSICFRHRMGSFGQ
jgi:hypothetical protein